MNFPQIFYHHLIIGECYSFKSQQFHTFLSNMGLPGSSCLLIILWSQKCMRYVWINVITGSHNICYSSLIFFYSFDRLLLAVVWTLGILSCNKTNDKDIKYVARQIEKKKAWMYYSERISISPLK